MDITARLPLGNCYDFWEREPIFISVIHVDCNDPNASDENDGSESMPLKTINEAAQRATPGTKVLIHSGIYRECVEPLQGGISAEMMISYEAFASDEVIIKASEVYDVFSKSEGWNVVPFGQKPYAPEDEPIIWKVKLNPEDFKGYNPFCAVNILHDRLFIEYEKTNMSTYLNRRGMIFCDGIPLKQVALYYQLGKETNTYWVEANGQTVHFRLENDSDPVNHQIELTVREQCFVPTEPFTSYIRIKGIICAHAATGAPVPQRGAISCYRGHHWIIEDCVIEWSNAVGIDIGNECWHHERIQNQVIGSSVVRGCKIFNVGVCGIAGLFAENLLIEDNLIEGTGWQKMELSWEAAGIKIHGCRNSLIRRNIFTKTFRADHLWLDMFNENNRITQNLFLDGIEQREAIFIECSRDEVNLIDHNIFWNIQGRFDPKKIVDEPGSSGWYKLTEHEGINGYAIYSEGTDHLAIVHNFIGNCRSSGYMAKPVPFRIVGDTRGGTGRNASILNNMFYDCKEAAIKMPTSQNASNGNLFLNMPGGYLRIMYPEPEVCLDLKAWREFYNFDVTGEEGLFDIDVDTDNYTMCFKEREISYFNKGFFHQDSNRFLTCVANIKKRECHKWSEFDFFGNKAQELRLPGPFANIEPDGIINIDPRRR